MNPLPDALNAALHHHQVGRLQEAETIYRHILQEHPNHPDALHLLGVLAHQAGRYREAVDYIGQAIAQDPRRVEFHYNIAQAYRAAGKPTGAIAHYNQALALNPGLAEAHNNLGNVLKEQGELEGALAHYRLALALNPGLAEAHNNLGVGLQEQGSLEEAVAHYQEALALKPNYAEAQFNFGNVLREQGRLESAATAYRKAIALKPEYVDAYTNLGVTLQQQGQLAEATAIYRKTLTLRPNLPEAHFNLAAACQQQGRSEEAISHYQQAIALRPEYAEAHFNLGNALKDQNDLEAAVAAFRQAIALRPDYADAYVNLGAVFQHQGLLDRAIGQYRQALTLRPTLAEAHLSLAGALELEGKTQEALESYRQALSLKPNDGTRIRIATILPVIIGPDENVVEMRKAFDQNLTSLLQEDLSLQDPVKEAGRTNFYLAYHGKYDRELQGKVAQLYERSCPSLLYSAPHCQGSPAPVAGRKIRVGFLSRFFWNHSIGKWMRGLIAHLSRREFEVLVFSFPRPPDEISTAIARAADRFIVCPPDLDAARQRVAQERLDILCYPDIGMEPLSYFLAFARLAPVQCTTLGHTVTTGIRTVDYFLSSALLEPADAATHYTERLVRFRHLPAYYYRPASPGPLLSRTELGLPEGKTLYVCPQSLFKLHPDFDSLLAGILQADPRGEVVLIEGHQKPWTERLQRRFRITIPAGVDRIRFVPRQPPHGFQSLLAAADVLLDSLPVGGGITTFEALHLGIPIVTLPGEFSRGRVTSACYRQMGVLDCVANSPQEYVALAVRLAQDRPYRAAVQGKILAAAGVLYENIEAVRELEQFFREAMQKLEQGPAQGSAKETRG